MNTTLKINRNNQEVQFRNIRVGELFIRSSISRDIIINMRTKESYVNDTKRNCVQIYFEGAYSNGYLFNVTDDEMVTPVKEMYLQITI